MTHIADVEFDLGYRAPGGEAISAAAFHESFGVSRVDAFFHLTALFCLQEFSVGSLSSKQAGPHVPLASQQR